MSSGMFGWVVAATVVHFGALVSLSLRAAAEASSPAPTEIDIAPLVEAPPREEPTNTQAAPVAAQPPTVAPKTIAPRPVAKAAAMVVVNDPAKASDDPISFPDDPDGDEPGVGIVAKNGSAKAATAPPAPSATTPPRPVAPPASAAPPAIVNLSRKPSLSEANACKGFFPAAADDDEAVVSLEVSVRASGEVAAVTVVAETPRGQGFGAAARSCLLTRRFMPALDANGQPTPAATPIRVHFAR